MEDDSPQRGRLEDVRLPVKGMESVLATVSGYHGAERFNLIKLITRAGASYVGNMTPMVTHLVCWKFEGKKYEFAKKLKILIVNHRWIEECIKKGRRVSEEPYTFQSGKETGPLCLDIHFAINHTVAHSKMRKKLKDTVIDIECEDTENAVWDDPILFNEDLSPEIRKNSFGSDRSLRKAIKRNSRKDCASNSRHCENPPEPIIVELEEPGTSQSTHFRRLGKRNHTSPERHYEGRKLLKKQTTKQDSGLTSNVDRHQEVKTLHENISLNVERDISDKTCSMRGQNDDHALTDIEEIEDVNDELHDASCTLQNSKERHEGCEEDHIDIDLSNRASTTSELSCVICWTEFSSTRGVLPCGHRFCFPCIQNWADHMASQRKTSTCPLCKANFICITKVDDAHSSDQKIYSQTIPHDSSKMDLYILPEEANTLPANPSTQVCYRCSSREPEDLLIKCHFCNIRCVHRYCLDPPLFPWTCVHCQDLRMLYNNR